jgi:hypothetical protein
VAGEERYFPPLITQKMDIAYDLISRGSGITDVLLVGTDFDNFHYGGHQCRTIRLHVSPQYYMPRLIYCLQRENCTVNFLYFDRVYTPLVECLANGQLPRITTLSIAWDTRLSLIEPMMRSPHSSITTLVWCANARDDSALFEEYLVDVNCQVINVLTADEEEDDVCYTVVRIRKAKVLLLAVSSAKSSMGKKSALQHLAQVLVRHIGTFLV